MDMHHSEEHVINHPSVSKAQLGVFAASAAAGGVIDAVTSGGWIGVPIVAVVALALAAKSPDFAERAQAVPLLSNLFPKGEPGKRSFWDNMLARPTTPSEQEVPSEEGVQEEAKVLPPPEPEEESAKKAVPQPQDTTYIPSIIGSNPERRLNLADNFQPDANAFLETGVGCFGCPGSGKTTVVVDFFEEYIDKFRLPCVIFDSQGDFKSLVEDGFCPRGVIATPTTMPSMAQVLNYGLQVVVDLSEWHKIDDVEMDFELAADMMHRTIRSLMRAQHAIEPKDRISCLVGIDELHLWVPQKSPSYMEPETAKALLETMITLATTGRKLGVVPFTATQRIARVNKDVIGGFDTRIFGRVDLDNDLDRYREYVSERTATDAQIRGFRQGEMVVCMGGRQVLVQFYNRQTRHTSHTPHITGALSRFQGRLPEGMLERLAGQQAARFSASVAQRPPEARVATAPKTRIYHGHGRGDAAQRTRARELSLREKKPAFAPAQGPSHGQEGAGQDSELERALQAYRNGATSIDKLQATLGLKRDPARNLYARVKMALEKQG